MAKKKDKRKLKKRIGKAFTTIRNRLRHKGKRTSPFKGKHHTKEFTSA